MSPRLGVFSLECMSGLKEAGKANWIRFHVHIPVEGIHSSEKLYSQRGVLWRTSSMTNEARAIKCIALANCLLVAESKHLVPNIVQKIILYLYQLHVHF